MRRQDQKVEIQQAFQRLDEIMNLSHLATQNAQGWQKWFEKSKKEEGAKTVSVFWEDPEWVALSQVQANLLQELGAFLELEQGGRNALPSLI